MQHSTSRNGWTNKATEQCRQTTQPYEWQRINVWDWLRDRGTTMHWQGLQCVVEEVREERGPWPACWGLEGRCAGGAASERTHRRGYAHQPSWPGASEAEWGAESAPLAEAEPGFRRPEASERAEGWEKILENHMGSTLAERVKRLRGQYPSASSNLICKSWSCNM